MESERCLRRVWPKDGPVMDSIQIVSSCFMSTKSKIRAFGILQKNVKHELLTTGGSFTARAACPQFLCLGMARMNSDSL